MLELVVEELEGLVLGERDEPQGHLGQLDGEGIEVHAIEAAFGHKAPRPHDRLLMALGQDHLPRPAVEGLAVGHGEGLVELLHGQPVPRVHEPVGQIAASLHQKRPGAHRRIADLEGENGFGGLEAVGLAFTVVDQRLQRPLTDERGDPLGRVVGPLPLAQAGLVSDVEVIGRDCALEEAGIRQQFRREVVRRLVVDLLLRQQPLHARGGEAGLLLEVGAVAKPLPHFGQRPQ